MAPEHMEELLVFTWPPRTPDPNPIWLQQVNPKKPNHRGSKRPQISTSNVRKS